MEPGHEDREYILSEVGSGSSHFTPQWSPVMKTGNTEVNGNRGIKAYVPQWSPVMKTGNTTLFHWRQNERSWASMEPGHEDREYNCSTTRRRRDE